MAGDKARSNKEKNTPTGGTITASAVSASSKVSEAQSRLAASESQQKAIAANAMANATTPRQKRIAEIMTNTNAVQAMKDGKDVVKTLRRSAVIDNIQSQKTDGGSLRSGLSRLSTVEKRAKANKKAAETRAANKAKRGKVSDAFAVPNSRR